MNDLNKIGFGVILGSLSTMILMCLVFGNGFEAFLCFTPLIIGCIMYDYNRWTLPGRLIKTFEEYRQRLFPPDSRLKMKVGSLVRIKSVNSDIYQYYKVQDFYQLNNGGEGVHFKGLGGGIISTSLPISHIEEVLFFLSIHAMQQDINQNNNALC